MYNDDPVIITVEGYNKKIIQELSWDANSTDILNAIYTAAVGCGFEPEMFLNAMKDFAEDHLPDKTSKNE